MRPPERHVAERSARVRRERGHVEHRHAAVRERGGLPQHRLGRRLGRVGEGELVAAVHQLAVGVAVKLAAGAAAEQRQPEAVLHHQLVALQR